MKINEILTEHVVNLHDDAAKRKYADKVWDILQTSYKKVPGGFGTAATIDELITKSGLWKLITRNGEITSVNIYRDQHGRKSIAAGTNGSFQGLKDYSMTKDEDNRFNRAWGEVSGKPEIHAARAGLIPIPSTYAPFLTRKEILSYNDDGVHYTRLIAGEPHEKIIYGSVHLSTDDVASLLQLGIKLHELPENFKILDK